MGIVAEESGGVEFGHALATEVITDVITEESAPRFGSQEGLIIGGWELEVSINVAGVTESQVQDLLRI